MIGLKRPAGTVMVESLVVGLIFVALYVLVAVLYNALNGAKTIPVASGSVAAFLAAVIGHWVFEIFGLNEYFCNSAKY